MNELIVDHSLLVQKVIDEYIDVLDTVQLRSNLFVPYIPNVFDMVNALPGVPWADAMVPILDVIYHHHIFVKFNGDYFSKPIVEVW